MNFFFNTLLRYSVLILPWFVVGSVLAFFVERYLSPRTIKKLFGKTGWRKLLGTQLLGMLSPLSIMSFLPVAGSLTALGAEPGLLLGFLAAERAYDFQSFFIVQSLFGLRFAILNFLAIFISVTIASWAIWKDRVKFKKKIQKENGFWKRQIRTFLIVAVGITLGAILRVAIPASRFDPFAQSPIGGLLTALILGALLYFGPLIGNYPVVKALAELGMAKLGVFAFLTVSPIFNVVVITLFFSSVEPRFVLKHFGVYTSISLVLSILVSPLL